MKTLVLSEKIERIGKKAFKGCNSKILKTVTLPSTLETINEYVFSGCPKLNNVKILNSCHISNSAFSDCKKLSKIEVKSDKTKISSSAFADCAINDFNSEKLGENSFVIKNGLAIFKVGKEIVPLKITNHKLKDAKIIEVPSGATKIEIETFDDCFCRLLKVPLSVKKNRIHRRFHRYFD